jgi:hypothetical protein
MASKKPKRKKKAAKAKVAKGKAGKAKSATRKKPSRRKTKARQSNSGASSKARIHQGVALGKAEQSGDLQGLSTVEDVDSESVAELEEEGQSFEAGIVSGVENAPDADEGEIHTREVPEDDVPSEYQNPREKED